jgi:hypothetical protein
MVNKRAERRAISPERNIIPEKIQKQKLTNAERRAMKASKRIMINNKSKSEQKIKEFNEAEENNMSFKYDQNDEQELCEYYYKQFDDCDRDT